MHRRRECCVRPDLASAHLAAAIGPDWTFNSERSTSTTACFGPANWYATVTPLAEVTDVEDEVNFQTRMIVGREF